MSNRKAYQRFCQELPDLPIYLEHWYLEGAQENEHWDAALVYDKGRVVGALPYFIKKKWGFRAIVQPVFVKYTGPVLHPEYRSLSRQHRYFAQLIGQLPQVHAFKQHFHPGISNWLPFHWAGFRQTTRYTYRLDISDPESVMTTMSGNKRREIIKADARFHLAHDLGIETFYRINKMSFDRQGLDIPYSLQQLQRHDTVLAEHRARKVFFALDEQDRIHSAAYLIWDRQRAYFHLAGDDPDLRHEHAGFWLIWQCIRYARQELGLREFDFEGSMIKPIEAVRRRIGAHQVPYFFVWKYNSRLYQLIDYLKNGWPS